MSAKSTEKETTNKKTAMADQEQVAQDVAEKPVEAEEKTTGQKTEKPVKASRKKEQKTVEKPEKKQVPKKPSAATKKTEKPEPKTDVYIEYQENQILESDIIAKVVEYVKKEHHKRESSIKSLRIYIKPEESKVYYVVNDDPKKLSGSVDLY